MTRLDLLPPAGRARPGNHPTHASRREVSDMDSFIRTIDAFHADRAARFAAEAERARIARDAHRPDDRRVRRIVGRSIVRVGARIAAEAPAERLQPAGPC